jgi:hypothetical protein
MVQYYRAGEFTRVYRLGQQIGYALFLLKAGLTLFAG